MTHHVGSLKIGANVSIFHALHEGHLRLYELVNLTEEERYRSGSPPPPLANRENDVVTVVDQQTKL